MLGELEIRAVRVSDIGKPKARGRPAPEQDLNEIVVTGDSERKTLTQRLCTSMDMIGHCTSIIYKFEAIAVTLMYFEQPTVAT